MCTSLFIKPTVQLNEAIRLLGVTNFVLPTLMGVEPDSLVPVIHKDDNSVIVKYMRWWFHPCWAEKEPNREHATFNARIESVLTSSTYRGAIQQQRGIIPVSAFVEWQKNKKFDPLEPYLIEAKTPPLLLAVVWDIWNEKIYSCAVISHQAPNNLAWLNSRVALSLDIEYAKRWLDPEENIDKLIDDLSEKVNDYTAKKLIMV